jgi:hypothetical protein
VHRKVLIDKPSKALRGAHRLARLVFQDKAQCVRIRMYSSSVCQSNPAAPFRKLQGLNCALPTTHLEERCGGVCMLRHGLQEFECLEQFRPIRTVRQTNETRRTTAHDGLGTGRLTCQRDERI